MTARLIDGNALARQIRAEVAQRVSRLAGRGLTPGLAVILVGDNPASQVYVKHKVSDCESVGIRSVLDRQYSRSSSFGKQERGPAGKLGPFLFWRLQT